MRKRVITAVKQRFSIRKLSIGAASVLLGTSLYFMGGSATIVHAGTNVSRDAPQTETSKAGVQVESASAGEQKATTSDNHKIDENELTGIAEDPSKDDTAVNDAIDKYAQDKQNEQNDQNEHGEKGSKVLIRPSDKQPTKTVGSTDERAGQVKDIINDKISKEINDAKNDKDFISDYNKHGEKITNGSESDAFKDQGLSVDDEKDAKIKVTVSDDKTEKPIDDTKLGGSIDITYTNHLTDKEQSKMKINSTNKVIIDLHDKYQDKDITVTYSNLNNSYYLEDVDKKNKIKISRVDRIFSNIKPADNIIFLPDGNTDYNKDGVYDKCDGPQLIIYNDPSDGFYYNNIEEVSVKDVFYDDNGQEIKFKDNDKNKAWIFITSLNSDGIGSKINRHDGKDYYEKVKAENPDGSSANMKKLAGSTITQHDGNWWYSDESNASSNSPFPSNYPEWDNKGEDNRYSFVGAVAIQYQPGMTITYGSYDTAWGSHWANMQTQVVSTLHQRVIIYDPIKDSVAPREVKTNFKETVHYVYADGETKAADDNTQSSNWHRTETVDKITNKPVKSGEYDTDWTLDDKNPNYNKVDTKKIDGYHADKKSIKETAKISKDITQIVTYEPNGRIIPVDKDGDPIKGANKPVFPTDPNDPTKTTNGKIPTVKGYHPEKGKPDEPVNPDSKDPSKDITVKYVKTGTISIVYHDNTDDINLVGYGIGETTGDEDTSFSKYNVEKEKDDLVKLKDRGYVLDEKDDIVPTIPTTFNGDKQIIIIHVKHGTTTKYEEGKPNQNDDFNKYITRTINYKDTDGKDVEGSPDGKATYTQIAHFTRTEVIDSVTHKVLGYDTNGNGKVDITKDATDASDAAWVAKDKSDKFAAVDSKAAKDLGYDKVDKAEVGAITVSADSDNITETVTYSRKVVNKGSFNVQYIDLEAADDKDPVIYDDSVTGNVGAKVTYTTQGRIDTIKGMGYVLVKDGYSKQDTINDQNNGKVYYVTFKHGTTTKYEEGKPNKNDDFNKYITRTINYKDTDGKDVEGSPDGKATYTQIAHFTRTEVIDSVTHKVLGYDTNGNGKVDITKDATDASDAAWVAKDKSDKFAAVDSKAAKDLGYDKVDKAEVGAITVSADSDNITETVTYSRKVVNKGSFNVQYIDLEAADDKDPVIYDDSVTGNVGAKVTYTTQGRIDTIKGMGYVLVKDGYSKQDTINDQNNGKVYYVTFKHGTTTKYEEGKPNKNDDFNKYITRTINYKDTDGKDVEGSPDGKATYTQIAHFTRTEVIDSVTHKVLGYDTNGNGKVDITKDATDASDAAWVAKDKSDKFAAVDSKAAKDLGYDKVDKAEVGAITVSADSDNITETVTYSRKVVNKGSFNVQYIDLEAADDKDPVIYDDSVTGNVGAKVTYTTQGRIDTIKGMGYVLVKDGYSKQDTINDQNNGKVYYVTFKHGTTTKYEEGKPNKNDDFNKYITRTINYKDTDGKDVEGSPDGKATYTQIAHFTRTEVIDSVTHKVLGYDTNGNGKVDITKDATDASDAAWVAKDKSDKFAAVDSKAAKDLGYDKVDKAEVGAITVSADSDNITETVTYSRKVVNKGSFNVQYIDLEAADDKDPVIYDDSVTGNVGAKVTYTTQGRIDTIKGMGYVLVKDGYSKQDTINDQNNGKVYYVTFKHGTTTKYEEGKPNKNDDFNKYITRTINYKDTDGKDVEGSPDGKATYTQIAHFTRTEVIDSVTHKVLGYDTNGNGKVDITKDATDASDAAWVAKDKSDKFAAVDSKAAKDLGYDKVDKAEVGAITVSADSDNITETVTYSRKVVNKGSFNVQYIDLEAADDKDPVIYDDSVTGNVGAKVTYTTQGRIDTIKGMGYVLVKDGYSKQDTINDQNNGKVYYVTFKHGTTTKYEEGKPNKNDDFNKYITRTINYKDTDGKDVEGSPDGKATYTQIAHFTRTEVIDSVTHKVLGYDTNGNGKVDITKDATDASDAAWVAKDKSDKFAAVDSKAAKDLGYDKVDKAEVGAITVSADSDNITETVTYSRKVVNKGSFNVQYIDLEAADDKDPVIYDDSVTGNVGAKVTYTTQGRIDTIKGMGYVLVKDGYSKQDTINDQNNGKVYYVTFKHGTTTKYEEGKPNKNDDFNKYITRTINYKDTDGKDVEGSPDGKATYTQIAHFTRTEVIDSVTHKVLGYDTNGNGKVDITKDATDASDAAWVAKDKSDKFAAVDSKAAKDLGYDKVDKAEVGAITVSADSDNITETVTYSRKVVNKGSFNVQYIDLEAADDKDPVIYDDSVTGNVGAKVTYTTQGRIDTIKGMGYVLVKDGYSKQDTINDQNNGKVYYVTFKHGTTTKYEEGKPNKNDDFNKYITRTINYKDTDGKDVEGSPDGKATYTQIAHFTRTEVIDSVTHKVLGYDTNGNGKVDITKDATDASDAAWVAKDKSDKFAAVDSKAAKDLGYDKVDKAEVGAITVSADSDNITETVTYSRKVVNKGSFNVQYIDLEAADDKDPVIYDDSVTGNVGAKVTYTTQGRIDTIKGMGYVLVKDGYSKQDTINDQNNGKVYYVTFKHGTTTKYEEGKPNKNDDFNKYITRTINYKDTDGKDVEGSPDGKATYTQIAHFTRTEVIDSVTHKVLGYDTNGNGKVDITKDATDASDAAWVAKDKSDKFAAVDSKAAKDLGYDKVDKAEVGAITVSADSDNITETVTYSRKPIVEQGSITVKVHDDTTDNELQDYGKASGTQDVGTSFDYDKASVIKNLTNAGYKVVNPEIVIPTVIIKGDQTFTIHVVHTTTTVTPENPGKPGEPINPNDPDPNGPKWPAGTDADSLTKTGTQTIHYVGAGDKTPADNTQTFTFIKNMVIDKVTGKVLDPGSWNAKSHTFGNVDTPVIPGYHADKAVAGGATVTPDDLEKVITVTYAPDGGSGDNPGSNGGGDQGTTPTPDDQPDTTLPSDNNTDKDVEKDKQDKPKKVKKARKIIKTRITKQEHIGNAEKAAPLVEQEHNDQTVASPVKNEANEPQLPQTGEANTSVIGLIGMLVAGFAAILGFESSRSRKHKN